MVAALWGENKEWASVLQAYFDESERQSGTFCVAGYAFAAYQGEKFIKEWDALFAPFGGFHMREFAHGRGRFDGTSQAQRHEMLHKAVQVINSE